MMMKRRIFDDCINAISDLIDELELFAIDEKKDYEKISTLIRRKQLEDIHYLLINDLTIYEEFDVIEDEKNMGDRKDG